MSRRGEPGLTLRAQGTTAWWLEPRDFFGGLKRERIWVFWRRVPDTPARRNTHHANRIPPYSPFSFMQVQDALATSRPRSSLTSHST
jgi:hypothetical protein